MVNVMGQRRKLKIRCDRLSTEYNAKEREADQRGNDKNEKKATMRDRSDPHDDHLVQRWFSQDQLTA